MGGEEMTLQQPQLLQIALDAKDAEIARMKSEIERLKTLNSSVLDRYTTLREFAINKIGAPAVNRAIYGDEND